MFILVSDAVLLLFLLFDVCFMLTDVDDHLRPGADLARGLLEAQRSRYRRQHQREIRQQGESC